MKLNLGCGELRREGADWLNLDYRPECADIVCDVAHLTFADHTADEIVALDLLEHFPAAQTHDVLTEWARVLRHGGRLTVKVPNMSALCEQLIVYDTSGRLNAVHAIIRNIYGGHRWGPGGAWDTHHAGFTLKTLTADLDEAGFDVESCDHALNMRIVAVRR